MQTSRRVPLFVAADLNGFFGLLLDNLSILGFVAAVLVGGAGMPADIVFGRMFPGTALGVLLGNLAYTWMARKLAQMTGRDDVTAMPLGLDAPTSIGLAVLVLAPAFAGFKAQGMDAHAAGIATWQLGMAALVVIGSIKFVLSFAGDWITRVLPRAALLGSIGGAALTLLGFLPLIELLREPVAGFVTLGVLLYALLGKGDLPAKIPGVLFALIVGVALHYGLGASGFGVPGFTWPAPMHFGFTLPLPNLGFVAGLHQLAPYLALLLPFALLMVVGGINVAESARAAGDDYRTRDVLLVEALATLVAGLCGGVVQTTPYIGQPAYKAMGARSGYTLLMGVFVGLGGVFGWLTGLVQWLPVAALAPVIVFVGLDITVQAFAQTPKRHLPAVALAFLPAIAYLLGIKFGVLAPQQAGALFDSTDASGFSDFATISVLGNGFIISAMLWASACVALIESRLRMASGLLLACALLAAFGVIHSVDPRGGLQLPWQLQGLRAQLCWQFVAAYAVLAAVFLLLSLRRPEKAA